MATRRGSRARKQPAVGRDGSSLGRGIVRKEPQAGAPHGVGRGPKAARRFLLGSRHLSQTPLCPLSVP
eukprot:1976451-Rhodomonas_salina.1